MGPHLCKRTRYVFDDLMKSMRWSFIIHVLISCTHMNLDLCGSAMLVIVGFAWVCVVYIFVFYSSTFLPSWNMCQVFTNNKDHSPKMIYNDCYPTTSFCLMLPSSFVRDTSRRLQKASSLGDSKDSTLPPLDILVVWRPRCVLRKPRNVVTMLCRVIFWPTSQMSF